MKVKDLKTSSARWWDYQRRIMIWKSAPASALVSLDCRATGKRFVKPTASKTKLRPATGLILAMVATAQLLGYATAQVELGYRDLLYPDRLTYAAPEERPAEPDPLQRIRTMTRRATITVDDRDQERFLTVFRASKHGHVEFGFPPSDRRATGSLEILDVSRISSRCCSVGIRMVAARHACSDSYLTLDRYGQMRACQISDTGVVTPLRSHTHCVEGEKLHVCTQSPYFFLDPVKRFQFGGQVTSQSKSPPGVTSEKRYKIRFEQKRKSTSKFRSVYYATVTASTWEIKLRPQSGVLRRATLDAVQRLWVRSLRVLFSKTITAYEKRRLKRNFWVRSPCDIDPATVRDFLIENASSSLFRQFIDARWRSSVLVDQLATSIAWSDMTNSEKDVFVLLVIRVVKRILRDSLLNVTNLHCLGRTRWGRLSRVNKLIILERSLTTTWMQRRTEARQFVLESMNEWLDTKLTTFLIKEDG